MFQDRGVEQNDVDAVVEFYRLRHGRNLAQSSFACRTANVRYAVLDWGMTKNMRLNSRITSSLIRRPSRLRAPRGVAMLRALRLRLAAEKHPRFQQEEFQFGN